MRANEQSVLVRDAPSLDEDMAVVLRVIAVAYELRLAQGCVGLLGGAHV